MDGTRFDRWSRRGFGLAVGGATAALLGLAEPAPATPRDRRGRSGPVRAEKKKKKAKVAPGPAGPPGPGGLPGPAGSPGVAGPPGAAPTRLATKVVAGPPSSALGTTPASVEVAIADCGGPGRVVDCGFSVVASQAAHLVNVLVRQVRALDDGSGCLADLVRTAAAGSTSGAAIQAIATCLE
jgi:hypothetical protein